MGIVQKLKGKDLDYLRRRKLAADAYQQGYWIYNSREQKWYTLEEFMAIPYDIDSDVQNGYCRVHNPRVEVMSKLKDIEKMQAELVGFIGRINTYYNYVPRREKK